MNRSRRIKLQIFRITVFLVLGAFFLVPIGAMFEFSTRGNAINAPRTLEAWIQIAKTPGLGAGLGTVMWRVVLQNMPSVILNACLLSVALVLGEYTFANLMNYENLQVAIAYVGLTSAGTSIAVAVASLIFAFALLLILSFVRRPRTGFAAADPVELDLAKPLALSGAVIGRAGR